MIRSLGQNNLFPAIQDLATRQGKTAEAIEEGSGFLKCEITPNLSTGEKNALQTLIDKIGTGTIT